MNKVGKLLIVVMLVCGFLFSVTGCTDHDQPFVPPEPDGSKVSINDAYDWNEDGSASTRPDLGGDYEPTLPPTESVVTIGEGSSVRFKDGATSITLPLGGVLKETDFDESTLGGHKIGGVAYLGEEGKIGGYNALADFAPMENVTVLPYYAPENGDLFIYGSNKVGDYFYDDAGKELDSAKLITEYSLVDGYMGKRIDYAETLTANSYFRAVTVCQREDGQKYKYFYTFANLGTSDLAFTVYQMFGGHAWNDPEMRVASDPLTLTPGASTVVSIEVDNTKNDANTLTLIRMDAPVTGLSLGVSMEVANTTVTEPATITLELPAGFTISGYETNVRTNDKLTLPTAAQIKNETGHNLLYWAYADGTRAVEGKRITGNITLKPVLTEDAVITLELPSGFTVSSDYATVLQTGDTLTLPTEAQIKNDTGRKLIRWVDGSGNVVTNGLKVTGNMTLKPELSSPATITVKLPAGLTLAGDYVKNAQTGDKLIAPTAEQVTGSIADGRKIEGWYVVGDNSVITDKTEIMETSVTIAPYFSRRAGTATLCNFGDAKDGKPLVFSNVQSSQKPMNVYPAAGSTLAMASFNAIANAYSNDTAIGGGNNGYAELGNLLSYNGAMINGDAFRCGTKISDGAAVVKKGLEHTFYYNFENLGDEEIHLTIQGVNNGTEVEGPISNIDLLPGESTVVTFKVTYTKGNDNKNVMGYFTVTEAMNNMKLGVSVNVVLGKESASVTLKSGIEGFTLGEGYLDQKFYVGDTLSLPNENDYTDTLSAKRRVIGWQDAKGNTLENGTAITGNIELVPIFEYFATVSFELPEGITFTGGFETQKTYVVGEKLMLPTDEQIDNTLGKAILYWMIKDSTTAVDNETEITADMTIVPYLESDVVEPVTITAGSVDGFTIAESYLNLERNKGDRLVLPTESEYTNDTGKKLVGWMDKTTNSDLTEGMIIEGDIVLLPILEAYAEFTIDLPDGLTLKNSYNTKYSVGDLLVLPTAEDIEANDTGMGELSGWFDVKKGSAVSNETIIADGLTIAPYWQNNAGYNYVKVGSGSAKGYNTDEMPGDIAIHANATENKSVTYKGHTTAASSTAAIVYGGTQGYSVLGSVLSDTAPVTAGSAIRFDSKHAQTYSQTSVIEFNYTLWNKGMTDLHLSIYQIGGSSEYKAAGEFYDYEKRYRVNIELAPGESTVATVQYVLEVNSGNNTLSYIVFEKDVSSFSFGFAISSKIIENATDVDAAYKGQEPLANPVTLTYDPAQNSGITVKDSYLTQRAGKFITAPTANDYTAPDGVAVAKWQLVIGDQTYDLTETIASYTCARVPSSGATLKAVLAEDLTVTWQSNNGVNIEGAKKAYKTGEKLALPALSATTDGRTHLGWFDTATKKVVTAETVVTKNMTIAPYFASGTALMPASGQQGTDMGLDKFKIGSLTDAEVRSNFSKDTNIIIGDELGMILHYNAELGDKSAFRFKTSSTLLAGKTYKFTLRFTNCGNENIAFTVYQVKSGDDTASMPNKAVTLEPNATDTAVLTLVTGANGNALTYFVMNGATNGFDLGITMSVEEVTAA